MEKEILVQVDGLSRYYGQHCAVNDISFEVRRGEVMGFLGPNGAGKSTAMKIITGNLAPSSGRIIINGVDLLDRPKQAKAALGYLPDQPPLYRELTVDEYLTFCARINRILPKAVSAALDNAKQRCGLEQVGRRLIGNLSKGYQQRVGIAQAIIHSPDVVILDEPTVGLDPIQIREIRSLIRELGGDHSVILSTHILPEVQAICDRVQIINDGQLVLTETIQGLEHKMQASNLKVGFRSPPSAEQLSALPDVVEVEPLGSQYWRIHYHPDHNPVDFIVKESVKQDWGLYELTPEKMSLEDIFVNLTCSENHETSVQAVAIP